MPPERTEDEPENRPCHHNPGAADAEEPALPTYSEDGVDLTLIRWMLSLTPAERLRVGQAGAEPAHRLAGLARRV